MGATMARTERDVDTRETTDEKKSRRGKRSVGTTKRGSRPLIVPPGELSTPAPRPAWLADPSLLPRTPPPLPSNPPRASGRR